METTKQILNKLLLLFILFILSYNCSSQDKNFYLNKAKAEIYYKNYDKALIDVNKFIGLNKNNYESFKLRGNIYILLNKIDLAINDLNKANNIKKNSSNYLLAQAYCVKQDWEKANNYLTKYLEQKNKILQSEVFLCSYFNEFSKTKYWKNIWKKNWYNNSDYFYQNINYLIKNKKYTDALNQLDEKINKKKKYKDLYYRSIILYNLNDYKNSLKSINQAIKISHKEILIELRGKIYLKLKKPKKAINDFLWVKNSDKNNINVLFLLSQAYYKAKKNDKAALSIEDYLNYYYKNDTALGLAGDIYYSKEEFFKSIKYFNRAIEINVKNGNYYKGRGKDFYITQSYKFAIQDFSVALDINPKDGEIYYLRGLSFYNINDTKNACLDWKNAMDNKYTDAYAYIKLNCQ